MKRITLFLGTLLFFLVFSPMLFAQTGAPPPLPQSPPEPYISISPDIFKPIEEILYIEGRANPNAIVTVQIRKEAGTESPIQFKIKTDASGEWVVAEKAYLSAGNWQVRARQQVGALVSSESNPRVIRSVVTGIPIFGIYIRYAAMAGAILLFIFIVLGIVFYFHKKINLLQKGLMEKQLRETEERFHRGFAEIRKELMDELKELATNAAGRPLTSEEIEKRDRVIRELESLEQGLDHDIGDIGKRY